PKSGVSKTSLAIAVGHARRKLFPDGVHFADLATIEDPALVPQIIARCFGISGGTADLESVVVEYMQSKSVLLILD
ncbi:hypothetical protein ACC695_41055, partial [Rhizobium ruizarguesonis]